MRTPACVSCNSRDGAFVMYSRDIILLSRENEVVIYLVWSSVVYLPVNHSRANAEITVCCDGTVNSWLGNFQMT